MTGEPLMSEPVAEPIPSDDSLTAGGLLRQAREAAGLHIGALAVSLKVPVRKLEALEADQFDSLPDMVFVRALASSVCRTLRVDPAIVLAKLPTTQSTPSPQAHSALNTPLRNPGYAATGVSRSTPLSRPLVVAVAFLLLGALTLFAWPYLQSLNPGQMLPLGGSPVAAATVTTPVTATGGDLPAQATDRTVSVVTAASTVTVAPASAPAPQELVATPALPAASGLVVFSVKTDTWVEVTDARGATSLRRLIPAGQTVGTTGNLPLAVTVGRADTTQVMVRGQPFDLAPVSRDNVARFQVK